MAAFALGLAWTTTAAHSATQSDAQAALAEAEQTEAIAGTFDDRWAPAEAALKTAHDALASQDWDAALAAANRALALAQRAVEQSEEQQGHWRDAVIH